MLTIVVGLVYKHTYVEPMVVQKSDKNTTKLVFPEGKEIKKCVIPCNLLRHGLTAG